jgi:hypothetical protein
MARQNIHDVPDDELYDDDDRPRKKKKNKKRRDDVEEAGNKAASYGIGVVMVLIGIGFWVGFYFTTTAPSKLFNLLAAGGAAMILSGVGLFVHPLNDAEMKEFQNNPNPIAVFRIMPVFWKIWLLVILAAMIAAFVFVAMVTVRVGR